MQLLDLREKGSRRQLRVDTTRPLVQKLRENPALIPLGPEVPPEKY